MLLPEGLANHVEMGVIANSQRNSALYDFIIDRKLSSLNSTCLQPHVVQTRFTSP